MMDVIKLLKNVINIDDYVTATHEVSKCKNLKVSINLDTVWTLTKIRSLEIEYLNKFNENGVACLLFEHLLISPPSKVWGVHAKELVNLLHYWLEAIRKHLMNHSAHWWKFLKLLLEFMKDFHVKDPSIPNMVLEKTAECWFALATDSKPDVYQKHKIIHRFNTICAASGREIRFVLRNKLAEYFVKMARFMVTSGYLPAQFSSLECLVRWLVPRKDRSLRVAALEKWLPLDLCPADARDCFLNNTWTNFYQDFRKFSIAVNSGNGLVTSMICRQLTIGKMVVIDGTEKEQSWIDFNTFGKSVSVLLMHQVLDKIEVGLWSSEFLVIDSDITESAKLRKESLGPTISLSMLQAPCIRPLDIKVSNERQVTIVLSSRSNLRVLDKLMRNTFGESYQPILNVDTDISLSPQQQRVKNVKIENQSEEDTRFSNPAEMKRKKHCGNTTKTRKPLSGVGSHASSTESTSSLLQLRDKLTALSWLNFDKCQPSACAKPSLSHVSELTEIDNCSIPTTAQKTFTDTKCRSDGDVPEHTGNNKTISSIVNVDSEPIFNSATAVSADFNLKKTNKRISKPEDYRDDNIVDLLLHEALEARKEKTISQELFETGINIREKKSQENRENIDDTSNDVQYTINDVLYSKRDYVKKCTVVSKTTTDDESNTEAIINETPFAKPVKNLHCKQKSSEVKNIEDFFSQHVVTEVVISPSQARKINETSSETSQNFDNNLLVLLNEDVNSDVEQSMFNDIEVIDCLIDMVEKVCSEFDKCTEYLYKQDTTNINDVNESELFKEKRAKTSKAKAESKKKQNIKTVKNKPVRNVTKRAAKKIKQVAKVNTKKMSTIIEQRENDTIIDETCVNKQNENDVILQIQNFEKKTETTETTKVSETPLLRRKRKLYSPKDDAIDCKIQTPDKVSSDDALLSELVTGNDKNTYKKATTCYKELEKERKKCSRVTRRRKTIALDASSPRTLKMNSVFDNLKQTVDSKENITFVDKNADVYNFTSDSEDEDFEKKKNVITKRVDASVGGVEKKSKNTRRTKETKSSCDEGNKAKAVKRKTTRSTARKSAKFSSDLETETIDLVDQRMREANRDILNTSVVIENPIDLELERLVPVIQVPEMEEINDCYILTSKKYENKPIKNNKSNVSRIKNIPKENTLILSDIETNDDFNIKVYPRTKTTKVATKYDNFNDTTETKKKPTRAKKTEILAVKKEKGLSNKTKTSYKDNDGTISPLPGLVVESIPKLIDDVNDSLTTNMLNKFRRLHRDGPDDVDDSVLTQNMLSDVEKMNNSSQNCTIADKILYVDMGSKDVGKKRRQIKEMARENEKKIVNIQIPGANDNFSDKSIATDGIRAHGDLDEEPPSVKTIKESEEPREIHDLDPSMRDYFSQLNREINKSASKEWEVKSVECEAVRKIMRKQSQTNISPVVSVKRLSIMDLSTWMPSRRTSECSLHSSPEISQGTVKNTTICKSIPISKVSYSPDAKIKSKSPTVALPRMSLEEFNKWLPIPDSFENKKIAQKKSGNFKLVFRTRSQSRARNIEESMKKDAGTDVKTEPSHIQRSANSKHSRRIDTETEAESNDVNKSDVTSKDESENLEFNNDVTFNKRELHNKRIDSSENETRKICRTKYTKPQYDTRQNAVKQSVKPMISPIKIADNFERSWNTKMNRSKVSQLEPSKSVQNMESEVSILVLKPMSKNVPSDPKKMRFDGPTASSSYMDAKVDDGPVIIGDEPRSIKPKIVPKRQIQTLEDVTLAQSSRSVSSVKEWLMEHDLTEKPAPVSHRDAIQNIMEKVDTTLVETNQNTSKMFVKLFMETYKRLELHKSKESETNKQFAAELHSEIVKEASRMVAEANRSTTQAISEMVVRTTEKKFAELHRISQDTRTEFMESLKKQVFEAIREDCKRKRVMVTLLKEDVQEVSDYINSNKENDSP